MSLLCFGGLYTRIHKCLIFYPYLANDDFHNKIAQNSSLESSPKSLESKADSSVDCHALPCAKARNDSLDSTQPLESTFAYKAPDDYKFHCFGGQIFIQVDTERFTSHTRTMFDTEWNALEVVYYYPLPRTTPPKPKNLPTMLDIARLLSKSCRFVRVDLYSICGAIIVGELTMTPEGGTGHFTPNEWDKKLGDLWH
ncbi:ATP-grasp fold amidoligase family protein [Helicobacter zhangjianzhongii]|nr:ATP-grasp fold amidoligase family protein [Helicobacter sp. CPD2-1]MDL0079641.1 hypothetical protein [Helicobacter sp. CPD2-1]